MRITQHTSAGRAAIRAVGVATVLTVLSAFGPTALADPPHGDGGHHHHVRTGNGECRDVDAVAFNAEDRGLHQGANASGRDHGPSHGSCQ